jgi:hypothetical protein
MLFTPTGAVEKEKIILTATVALLLPLAILQHLLVHPPELDMLSCAVRLCLALLTLDPFLLLVATSITIALLLIGISLRVHVTESGGLQARRSHTDLAPHVPLTKLCLLLSCGRFLTQHGT